MSMETSLGRRVLVTGADGFIGSHLMGRLRGSQADVRYLRHSASAIHSIEEAAPVEGDIRNLDDVLRATEGVTTIFHLAGIAAVGDARRDPQKAFAVNTMGTQNVLEAARRHTGLRVLILSTAHVYGPAVRLPVDETHPVAPASVYAATKYAGDVLALAYARDLGVPVTVLRPFNVYGPRQSRSAVIASIVSQAVRGEPVEVRDLRPRRDFVYVEDVVEALLLAATTDAVVGEALLLASGHAVSIASVIRRVMTLVSGVDAHTPVEPAIDSDSIFGDATRANSLLGWRPQFDLDSGLANTIAWWREHRTA